MYRSLAGRKYQNFSPVGVFHLAKPAVIGEKYWQDCAALSTLWCVGTYWTLYENYKYIITIPQGLPDSDVTLGINHLLCKFTFRTAKD